MIIGGLAALALATAAVIYWQWSKSARPLPAQPQKFSSIEEEKPGPQGNDKHPAPTWVNPQDGQNYVWIPPGSFTMGCSQGDNECADDEKPTHVVAIDKGFWLGQTEVSIAAYNKYAGTHGLKLRAGEGNLPVRNVPWAGAKAYCSAVGGRLPTEAEWEYAARGGRPEIYYGVLLDIAWYAGNSQDQPQPVGTKKPNSFGLYDMLGNVSEWVLDRYYKKYYPEEAAVGAVDEPLAPNASAVARGGFWGADAVSVRVSHRSELPNDEGVPTVGFRCVAARH